MGRTSKMTSAAAACRTCLPAIGALLVACSGGSGPTGPSGTPTPTSVSVAGGADVVKVGETVAFTASAGLSNGSTSAVQAQWTGDNPAVATVDGTGRVTGLSNGRVTITATYQSRTSARQLRVVPNYDGFWDGTVSVKACDQTAAFRPATWCSGRIRQSFKGSLKLEQIRDVVSGGLWLDAAPIYNCEPDPNVQCNIDLSRPGKATSLGLQFSIDDAGRLTGGGAFIMATPSGDVFGTAGGWSVIMGPSSSSFSGRGAISWTNPGPGNAYEEVDLAFFPGREPL